MKEWRTGSGHSITRLLGGRCNVFAVRHGGRFLLVDTGRCVRRRALFRRIDWLIASGEIFAALLLTHAHFDHAENAAAVAEQYRVPVLVSQADLDCLLEGKNAAVMGSMGFTRAWNPLLARLSPSWFRYDPVPSAQVIDGLFDEICAIDGLSVLETPGHTAGSVSVIVDGQIAIVGDAMHGVFPGSAFPPFAADENQLIFSWGCLLKTGCVSFLPSHGSERKARAVSRQYARRTARANH